MLAPYGGVKEEKLHALETQLYVFEETLEEDSAAGGGGGGGRLRAQKASSGPTENPTELFQTLLAQVTFAYCIHKRTQHTSTRKDKRRGWGWRGGRTEGLFGTH